MKSNVYELATCAIFAALMCILGPMSIPIGPIPVTLTNFVIYLAIYMLGMKKATISYLVYLLLGAVGLPVFSGYSGGLAKLTGPTGGYLVGFILMALIGGFVLEKTRANAVLTAIGMAAGLLVAYIFGTIWFVVLMKCDFAYALSVCVFPFIPFDLIKIVLATLIGKTARVSLKRAGLLSSEAEVSK